MKKGRTKPYEDREEVELVLNKYRTKLYAFVVPADAMDLRIREEIAVALVRVAQSGNLLAVTEVVELVSYTINGWLDNYCYISRWRGRKDEIRKQLEGCIHRYRYSGSFLRYVFRTLECAGRGIVSLCACSLDEPVTTGAREYKIDRLIRDPETNEVASYKPRRAWSFES